MSLNILTSGDFSISTQLENKLNMAFSLICEEEKLSNCSVNLKILNNNEIQELNKKYRKKNSIFLYYNDKFNYVERRKSFLISMFDKNVSKDVNTFIKKNKIKCIW